MFLELADLGYKYYSVLGCTRFFVFKKSSGVKSQDEGGQLMIPPRDMSAPSNFSRKKSSGSRAEWYITSSWWNHIFVWSIPFPLGKNKNGYHRLKWSSYIWSPEKGTWKTQVWQRHCCAQLSGNLLSSFENITKNTYTLGKMCYGIRRLCRKIRY